MEPVRLAREPHTARHLDKVTTGFDVHGLRMDPAGKISVARVVGVRSPELEAEKNHRRKKQGEDRAAGDHV